MKIRKLYHNQDGTTDFPTAIHEYPGQSAHEIFTMLNLLAPGMYTFEEGKVVYNGFHFKCTYIPCDEA